MERKKPRRNFAVDLPIDRALPTGRAAEGHCIADLFSRAVAGRWRRMRLIDLGNRLQMTGNFLQAYSAQLASDGSGTRLALFDLIYEDLRDNPAGFPRRGDDRHREQYRTLHVRIMRSFDLLERRQRIMNAANKLTEIGFVLVIDRLIFGGFSKIKPPSNEGDDATGSCSGWEIFKCWYLGFHYNNPLGHGNT